MTPAERVARGVELLDRVRPGWAGEIHQESLDMVDCCHCVLGQLFGDFQYGEDELFGYQYGAAGDHGFYTSTHRDYSALQSEWCRVIAERQAVTP